MADKKSDTRSTQCRGCDLKNEPCSCRDEIDRLKADNKELYEKNLNKDVTIIRQLKEKDELRAIKDAEYKEKLWDRCAWKNSNCTEDRCEFCEGAPELDKKPKPSRAFSKSNPCSNPNCSCCHPKKPDLAKRKVHDKGDGR